MMTPVEMQIFTACTVLGLVMCIYLGMASCYQTGVLGSIGLGLSAICLIGYVLNSITVSYEVPRLIGYAMIGFFLFLCQHVWRVIIRNLEEKHLIKTKQSHFAGRIYPLRVMKHGHH